MNKKFHPVFEMEIDDVFHVLYVFMCCIKIIVPGQSEMGIDMKHRAILHNPQIMYVNPFLFSLFVQHRNNFFYNGKISFIH